MSVISDEVDDSAVRLWRLLEKLQRRPPSNQPTGRVIDDAVKAGSPARSVGLLVSLLADVEAGLRSLEGVKSVSAYLVQIEPINDWLGKLNLGQSWPGANLDDRAVTALLTCSDQLQLTRPLRRADAEAIEDLMDQVKSLRLSVLEASGLDPRFRRFLLAHLHDLQGAMLEYESTGSARLAETVRCAAGDFAAERPVPKTQSERGLWQRFVEICRDAIVVVTAANMLGVPAFLTDAYEQLARRVPAIAPEDAQRELGPGVRGELGSGGSEDEDEEQ